MKGSVYINNGYWWYAVRLPGEKKRKARKLCAPGGDVALHADRARDVAVAAARRIWDAAARKPSTIAAASPTVGEVGAAWLAWCETYYRRPDGTATGGAKCCASGIRTLCEMFGEREVAELRHKDMLAVRDALVRSGLARSSINIYLERQKLMWRWALDEGLISAAQKAELSQVQGLKAYRSAARELPPVRPADDAAVAAVCAIVPQNLADMIMVQRLTGMRPGEVCRMRWAEIDESVIPWIYKPARHKNSWRGKERYVLIGPRARAVLERCRGGDRPFSPSAAIASAVTALERGVRNCGVPDEAAAEWRCTRYGDTVARAARRGGVAIWTPYGLRHAFATEVRRKYGLLAAAMLLGHSGGLRITQGYSREGAAEELVRECGAIIEAIG